MTKFSNKLKKPYFLPIFGPIFSILGSKKLLPENLALSRTTSHEILAPCQNLEKINVTIPRKSLDRGKDKWTDGRMDRRYFVGPFLCTAGSPKSQVRIT